MPYVAVSCCCLRRFSYCETQSQHYEPLRTRYGFSFVPCLHEPHWSYLLSAVPASTESPPVPQHLLQPLQAQLWPGHLSEELRSFMLRRSFQDFCTGSPAPSASGFRWFRKVYLPQIPSFSIPTWLQQIQTASEPQSQRKYRTQSPQPQSPTKPRKRGKNDWLDWFVEPHMTVPEGLLELVGRNDSDCAGGSATRRSVRGYHCIVQGVTMCNRSLKQTAIRHKETSLQRCSSSRDGFRFGTTHSTAQRIGRTQAYRNTMLGNTTVDTRKTSVGGVSGHERQHCRSLRLTAFEQAPSVEQECYVFSVLTVDRMYTT